MKRKIIVLSVCILLMFTMVACGEKEVEIPEGFTEEEYEKCQKVLETIEGFLNADISSEDAADKLEVLSDQLRGSETHNIDMIGTYADLANAYITHYGIDANDDDMKKIIDARDKIEGWLNE